MKYFEVSFVGSDSSRFIRADSAEDAARQMAVFTYGHDAEVVPPDREYFDVIMTDTSVGHSSVEDTVCVEERGNK